MGWLERQFPTPEPFTLKWYTRLLSEMKRHGIKIEDMPDSVAQSMLRLHQAALRLHMQKRIEKKEKR